jgi:ubiquinone/menaquinone biosynthesis C-methylase UbiE
VLDVGCGNGKYIGVNSKNLFTIGTDRSKGLLDTALEKDKNFQLFAADSLRLPVRSGIFDCFLSIAVIHHFSSDPLRHQAISELMRILRVSGKGLIYVWAMEQEERKFAEQDVFVPWNLSFKYEGKEELEKKKKA